LLVVTQTQIVATKAQQKKEGCKMNDANYLQKDGLLAVLLGAKCSSRNG